MHIKLRTLFAAVLLAGAAVPALAQTYPSRTVRIIVPFPPGGGIDIVIRAVAAELTERWKQAVVVENKPGIGSIVGAEAVAKAAPDGYTLLATVNQTITANRFLFKSLPYDPDKSFAPVTIMVKSDQMLLAKAALPAKDLRELVALARREPGKLNYGSYGNGSQPQLAYELLNNREKLEIVHIPYKGIAPLLTALAAGEVDLATGSANVAMGLIKGGKVKPLAAAGKERLPQFPDLPTTAELGFPYLTASIWYGLFAPAGTPAALLAKISDDVRSVLRTPAFAERHATSKGLEIVANSPQEVGPVVRDEVAGLAEMVRAARIEPE
ncbi:MAG: tripartite tricarboxylate transporter substrate binding protein [Proteobacteria bacterium]|nr:tripartite tricarboxylate transporter substrate binding protein [Pseudomonadota bacterium]